MDIKAKYFAFLESADKDNKHPELVEKLKKGYEMMVEAQNDMALLESTIALIEQELSPEEQERIENLPVEDKIAKLKEIARILNTKGLKDLSYKYMDSPLVKAYKSGLSKEQVVSATA